MMSKVVRRRKVAFGVLIVALVIFSVIVANSVPLKDAMNEFVSGKFENGRQILGLWLGQASSSNKVQLAKLYVNGEVTRRDRAEAVRWYSRAADQGNAEAQYKTGIAYENGFAVSQDYKKALDLYQQAAGQGYTPAMLGIATMFDRGTGIQKDPVEASKWLRKAADVGDATGQLMIGLVYFGGLGLPQDKTEAIKWLRKSADQNNPRAELMLSTFYSVGDGVPQDLVQAFKWAELASTHGDADAQFKLGAMYLNGEGVDQDYKKANSWLIKAASQGNASAQDALGRIYISGEPWQGDIRPNRVMAYAFFNLAASQGNEQASQAKDKLAEFLTPDQLTVGQSLASNWKPNDELPFRVSLENEAPDHLYGDVATSELMKATRVWFSRTFSLGKTKYTTVFLVTKGEDCHACGVKLGAVTYIYNANDTVDAWIKAQPNITEIGSWGDVPAVKDKLTTKDELGKVDVEFNSLGQDKAILLIGDGYYQQGEASGFKDVFIFDSNGWRRAGSVSDGGSNNGNCGEDTGGKCFSWDGHVKIDSTDKRPWPDLIVEASGTNYDSSTPDKVAKVKNLRYRFNGTEYALIK